jgi:hypothetical protein
MSTYARDTHRQLDGDYAEARDGHDLENREIMRPRRWRQDNVSGGRSDGPRVLLVKLTQKRSAKGTTYLSGWMGAARLVGFLGREPDKDGNQVWCVYAAEPQPKAGK